MTRWRALAIGSGLVICLLGGCSPRATPGSDAAALDGTADGIPRKDTRVDVLREEGGVNPGPCVRGRPAAVGRLCVRGKRSASGRDEDLLANEPIRFQVFPKGCYSSSCTTVHQARCTVTGGSGGPGGKGSFVLDALFCLEDTSAPGVGCTADCNGGRFADCTQLTGVGLFEVSIDNLKLNFAVPSTTTGLGGHCVGDPF